MKGMTSGVLHKNIAGLVRLGIDDAASVLDSYQELSAALAALDPTAGKGILIEPMVPSGVDLLIGAHIDPAFGPVVVFGWGRCARGNPGRDLLAARSDLPGGR